MQIGVIELTLQYEKGLAAVVLPDTIFESRLSDSQVVSLSFISLVGHRGEKVPSFCSLGHLLGNFSKLGEVVGGVGICINSCDINS